MFFWRENLFFVPCSYSKDIKNVWGGENECVCIKYVCIQIKCIKFITSIIGSMSFCLWSSEIFTSLSCNLVQFNVSKQTFDAVPDEVWGQTWYFISAVEGLSTKRRGEDRNRKTLCTLPMSRHTKSLNLFIVRSGIEKYVP